jgi:hypothetical protein
MWADPTGRRPPDQPGPDHDHGPAVRETATERRRVFVDFVDEYNHRHTPGSPWPVAVLQEWVAGSPLAKVSVEAAG